MSRRNVEAFFRAERIPHVSVDDAKRALRPDPYRHPSAPGPAVDPHFVAYSDTPEVVPNWIVYVGARKPEAVEAMREWGRLFGECFTPVFAKFRTHPEFFDIDGHPIKPSALTIGRRAPKPVPVPALALASTDQGRESENGQWSLIETAVQPCLFGAA